MLLSKGSLAWFIERAQYRARVHDELLVFDDFFARRKDFLNRPTDRVGKIVFGGSHVYRIIGEDVSEALLTDAIGLTGSANAFVALSSPRSTLRAGIMSGELAAGQINDIATGASEAYVSAYDGEGLLVATEHAMGTRRWVPKPL